MNLRCAQTAARSALSLPRPTRQGADSNAVRNHAECDPNRHVEKGIGYEVREDSDGEPASQWDQRLLLLAIQKETEAHCPEKQALK